MMMIDYHCDTTEEDRNKCKKILVEFEFSYLTFTSRIIEDKFYIGSSIVI